MSMRMAVRDAGRKDNREEDAVRRWTCFVRLLVQHCK